MNTTESHKLLNSLLELSNVIIEFGGVPGELQFNPTFYFRINKDQMEEVARTLAPVCKDYNDGYLTIRKLFPSFSLNFLCGERVCTVKAVTKVWVPECEPVAGYYREVYEYECPSDRPILTEREVGGDGPDPV